MVHNAGVRPRPSEDGRVSEDVLAVRFEQQVAMAPDRMAILTDRGEVTYRELDSMANGIAAMLRSSTLDPERPIALLLQDMILCVAAMLGAAKAGRIYIPLDIGFPETWLAQTLNTAEAALVFTDANTAPIVSRVAGEQTRIVELDQDQLRHGNVPRPAKTATRDAEAPAFILFTSGSTGQPKGVIHNHEFLVHQADTWPDGVPIGPQDRVSLVYSCAFAAGIISTFVALLGGACLCPFDLRARGLSEFSTWLADKRISVISMTSSLFRTWLAAVPKNIRYPALPTRQARQSHPSVTGQGVAAADRSPGWEPVPEPPAKSVVGQFDPPRPSPSDGQESDGLSQDPYIFPDETRPPGRPNGMWVKVRSSGP